MSGTTAGIGVVVGGPVALLPVKIPLLRSECPRRDCARCQFLFLSFLFLFYSSTEAADGRPREDAGLSRDAEVASDRIPAQQAIVRRVKRLRSRNTRRAWRKKSKKTSLPWRLWIDLVYTPLTDGRKTGKKKKQKKKFAAEETWVARLSPVDPRCIEGRDSLSYRGIAPRDYDLIYSIESAGLLANQIISLFTSTKFMHVA